MKELELVGKVFSGKGGGQKFVKLPWANRQITAKLGFAPYFGTLNIRLSRDSVAKRRLLEKAVALMVYPTEGYSTGKLFKATINTVECGIVIPEVPGYPSDILEIIASVNLREKLQLSDGDEIAVIISI